ncbi:hypothetical protein [Chryseobacterium sp. LAM-KRS1]|uniref:hypothetical protein n=1 Tax=Chryseobacterium sp. LAM-KRS1 TaxID=2715754 RepID=UPI0015528E04|nr:hypothetical protein [Chryseobacterium sp. LAM-KRS1]
METCFLPTGKLQFDEVYISDLVHLKQIFVKERNLKQVNEDFGLPFVMAKKTNEIIAFASLIINDQDTIDFVIFEAGNMDAKEKEAFKKYAEDCFKKAPSDNYNDPGQLKSTISRIINWINI